MLIVPILTSSLKWWYLILRYLVLGLILGTFAISITPALSSKTLQYTLGFAFNTGMPNCLASSNSHMIGNTSLIDCESAMYSDLLQMVYLAELADFWGVHWPAQIT